MSDSLPLGFILIVVGAVLLVVVAVIIVYIMKQRRIRRLKKPAKGLLPINYFF